jgi:Holliday junction resolvase RusA-like endonuclease
MTAPIPTTEPFFTGVMPLPPSINGSYKPRSGRKDDESAIAGTPELSQFKQNAALMLSNQDTTTTDWTILNKLREANAKRCQSPLAVTLKFYFPTEWKRDLDGPIKAAIDAAFLRLGLDDRLVIDIQAKKLVDPVEPRTEIEVRCVLR